MIELIQNGVTSCVTGAQRANVVQDSNGNPICTIIACKDGTSEVVYDITSTLYYGPDDRCWECQVACRFVRSPTLCNNIQCSGITKQADGTFTLTNVEGMRTTIGSGSNASATYQIAGYAGLQSWRTDIDFANHIYTYADTRKWYITGIIGTTSNGTWNCVLGCIDNPNGHVYGYCGRNCDWCSQAVGLANSVLADWCSMVADPSSYKLCIFEDRLDSYRSSDEGSHSGDFTFTYFSTDVGLFTCTDVAGTDCCLQSPLLSLIDCSYDGLRFAQSDSWFSPTCIRLFPGSDLRGSANWYGYLGGI